MMALAIFAASFLFNNANAQSNDGKFRLGIGVDGLVPVGSLTNTENFGLASRRAYNTMSTNNFR